VTRWSPSGRPQTDPRILFQLALALALLFLAVVVEQTVSAIAVETLVRWGIVGTISLALVAVLGWVALRARNDPEPEPRPEHLADVVGIRIAFDADAAAIVGRDLVALLRRPRAERLRAVARRLLDAQLDWRMVGLRTSPLAPEAEAARRFDAWSAEAREQLAPAGGAASSPRDALVVVCLHAETDEEISDLPTDHPSGVLRTLEGLAEDRWTVRRVELWTSRAPLSAATLRARDPSMIPARGSSS
jgi:hypothetical protein